MGIQLKGSIKESLEKFLKVNTDVTAYNTIEMLGVDPSTMVHHLNIKEDYKLVKQKKCPFTLNRQ